VKRRARTSLNYLDYSSSYSRSCRPGEGGGRMLQEKEKEIGKKKGWQGM